MSIQEDIITMKDGRVMIIRNDGMRPLEHEMTMPDGTRVGTDGTLVMPDGSTRMMEEGENITLGASRPHPSR